jgi:hypothetical protein
MKKAIAFVLAVFFLLSAAVYFAPIAGAQTRADACYNNWGSCRQRALDLDVAWWKVAVLLTLCDLSLGKCIMAT